MKPAPRTEFLYSEINEPHQDRAREIRREHPEILELCGHNASTFAFIVALVVLQTGLAYGVRAQPWWLVLVLAYVLGAFLTNGLFVLMHECNHNLVLRRPFANSLAGILANILRVVPCSVTFQRYHLTHHDFQGVHDLDGDMPARWEAEMVGTSPLRKAIWLLLFPVWLAFRPAHVNEVKLLTPWTALNMVVVFGFDIAVLALFGPQAFVYLLLCVFFSLGLHPLGTRWIQEHYIVSPPQETYSYYGLLNRFAFNIGYHNEHHDFPQVPWNRVAKIREIAHEWYDPLVHHESLTRLLLRFLFDRELTLFSRVARQHRGRRVLRAPARTDVA